MGCIVRIEAEKDGKSKVELNGRMMVIHLGEDLDHHNAMYIRELTDTYLEKYAINRILFDFSGVEFMDSSGIGLIMGRFKLIKSLGGNLKVINIPKNLERMMKLAGLEKLGIFESEDKISCKN